MQYFVKESATCEKLSRLMGLRAICAMTMVNSCVRYWQKINFLTVKKLLFLHVVEMGNENGNVIETGI